MLNKCATIQKERTIQDKIQSERNSGRITAYLRIIIVFGYSQLYKILILYNWVYRNYNSPLLKSQQNQTYCNTKIT